MSNAAAHLRFTATVRVAVSFASATLLHLLLSACSPGTSTPPVATPADNKASATAEQLRIIPPEGWALTSSSNRGNFRRARYERAQPDGTEAEGTESQTAIVETLTLEQLDPEGLPDPIAFLENLAAEQAERCDQFSSSAITSGYENGYASAVRLLRCPRRRVNRQATVSMAKAIQGESGYYLLVFEKSAPAQPALAGDPFAFMTESDIASWSLYLREARLTPARNP